VSDSSECLMNVLLWFMTLNQRRVWLWVDGVAWTWFECVPKGFGYWRLILRAGHGGG
jgi:hypothetical protein